MELEQLEKSVEANPNDPSLQFQLVPLFPDYLIDMGLIEKSAYEQESLEL